MNILITGIHGFVGSNLVNALKKDYQIYGLDIIDKPTEGIIKTFSWGDLEEKTESLPLFHAIIHLAGKAHDTKKNKRIQSFIFKLTPDLLNAFSASFREKKLKKSFFSVPLKLLQTLLKVRF